ncbi:MAG: GGDEF domain-containing protein [Deltaproteobacteria bacterium]|nr:MAG: GGDEF domain-containing protein [Deltaproteobacteria bacterium]
MIDGLETLLLERSPDLLVVLDGELKVVNASAGLRSAVPLVAPGEDFLRSLDDKSQARFRQAMTIDRDVTSALSLELVHRGKERLITTAYRFFGLERPYIGGVGREAPSSSELVDQVEVLRRRYHESVAQLASLTGRLRELAMIDSLTGVLNRRAFLDHADGEWVRHRRHNHVLACAMVDVDGFKKINDTFGHAAGDAVLQHIGALLRATLRASDLPARLGGDEFVALMPETEIAGAAALGERLLERVQQQPLIVLDQSLVASLSIGIASADGCNNLEELLAKADQALYRAKKEGRARVCIAA